MIAYINGLVLRKSEKYLVVLAHDVGYKIFVNTDVISKVFVDEKVQLHLHMVVREAEMSLYGFRSSEELAFFEQLIDVSGIGPKMGLEILSSPIEMTQQAILSEDVALLTKIKGLGKKTAERLILELKNKIAHLPMSTSAGPKNSYSSDAIEALVSLGYEKYQVVKVLSKMPSDIEETEEVVKYFLKTI